MKAAPTPPAITLSTDEIRLVMAFRAVDARGKRKNLATMESEAKRYPHRAAPALRLVQATASPAQQ